MSFAGGGGGASSGLSTAGAALTTGGVALAPLTGGLSLIGSAIGIGAGVLGAETGSEAATYTGEAQAAQANYQAGVAQANEQLAAEDVTYAENAGAVPIQEAGLTGRAEIGTTKAAYGAGNVKEASGSAGRVVSSEVGIAQENEQVAASNASKNAFTYQVAESTQA